MRNWTIRTNPTKYEDIKTYTILEPNPDAGKVGVCYSGSHFGVTTLDSIEDAQLISAAPEMYKALKAVESSVICNGDMSITYAIDGTIKKQIAEALAKADGK